MTQPVLLCTLAEVPGRTFQVRGLVIAEGAHAIGGHRLDAMMQTIISQAGQLGANAIVDIKVVRTGDTTWAITGTAVLLS